MEKLTNIELESVQLHETSPRSLAKDAHFASSQEDDVDTANGIVHVIVQGDRSKPAILTYHDIGLNSVTCFQGFFNYDDMQPILKHFCVYHVNAPGQQDGALPLPQSSGMKHSESEKLLNTIGQEETAPKVTAKTAAPKRASMAFSGDASLINRYQFPTMDQLAEMLLPVLQYYNLRSVIGFGVGAGANILTRFAVHHPDRVDALVLINATASKAGWTEWGYQKMNAWHLRSGHMSAGVEEYLLWHLLGKKTTEDNQDLVTVYTDYVRTVNPQNLGYFIQAYISRTDVGLVRELNPHAKEDPKKKIVKCPVMMVTGDFSPHLDDTVNMNTRLNPGNCTWMKFYCGGMILEEVPDKLCEAFRLFLQGMGYVPSLSKMNLALSRTGLQSNTMLTGRHAPSHVPYC